MSSLDVFLKVKVVFGSDDAVRILIKFRGFVYKRDENSFANLDKFLITKTKIFEVRFFTCFLKFLTQIQNSSYMYHFQLIFVTFVNIVYARNQNTLIFLTSTPHSNILSHPIHPHPH